MTLEEFKDVYKDKTPLEKLRLMQVQHDYWRNDVKDRVDAHWRGNYEEARYYANECNAMADRVAWLMEEISSVLTMREARLMNDLISRAAAIEAFDDKRVERYYGDVSPESVIRVIESIPAVDAAPVVHGKWIWISRTYDRSPCEARYMCSKCRHETITHSIPPWEKYCPNCGAKMDEEQRGAAP